ncbi:MAG: DNA recombination protein RmuC [Akkermansiaceae bacterium]|nr:DNA recombination protein RmuC [Akkermansiaceae bacterium]
MIAVSIILFIVGCVLGFVVNQLAATRKNQEALVAAERTGVELNMLQQQKAEAEQKGQALQVHADKIAAELTVARTQAVSLSTALEHEKAQHNADNARLDALQKEYETTRNEFTSTLAELARCKTELEKEREQRESEASKIKEMQEKHFAQFRNLAGEILEQNAGKLKDTNKESMDSLLKPLRVQLESLGKAVTATNETAAGNKASLEAAIKAMMEKTESLGKDAENLTLALRGNTKKQGDWGEMILERMLEESGLRKGEEYYVQENHKTEEGKDLRPDVVIRFPEKRCVIVDSKVSLTAYAHYSAAENEQERSRYLEAHVASVRKHIDELAAKDYKGTVEDTISYVLMFVPNEASYMAAVQAAPSLPLDAYRKKIVLISPTNLLMALQLAYNLWQKERQTQNVEKIIDRATKLYDKLATVQESLEKVGKGIDQAQSAYSQAITQLFHGRGNYAKQLDDLRQMGISPNKRLKLNEEDEPQG